MQLKRIQKPDSNILETISGASKLATKRVYAFALILVFTIGAVYLIITNPDFLHSALSFKTIEDDEGVAELVNFSNQIAALKREKADQVIDLNNGNEFKEELSTNNDKIISIIFESGRLSSRLNEFEVNDVKNSFPMSFSYRFFGGQNRFRDADSLVYSGNVDFSKNIIGKIIENKDKFYAISDDEDVLSAIIQYFETNKQTSASIINKYLNLLDKDLDELNRAIESLDKQLADLNDGILKIVKRLRSDEYIYASVVLQKVMITVLIVSIGLYFLKALGADLLFIRKLTIINLSQVIANHSAENASKDSVEIYNAFASEEDKIGKAPETIAIKTLGEISKMFSSGTKK